MTIQAPPKTGFEKWQDGLKAAKGDVKWRKWDDEIQLAVREYNFHLYGNAGFLLLDWQLIKAMVWVETGASSPEWNTRPMQIGVPGDPGLTSLLSEKEGGELIVLPAWKGRLTIASVRSNPAYNIRAGIGYLLMRMANFEYRTVLDAKSKVEEVTVKAGDSLDRIAQTHGSTVDALRRLNSTTTTLRPGQVLRVQKASIKRIISGWRSISTAAIAHRYNGGGDPNYAEKLDFALSLIRADENHS